MPSTHETILTGLHTRLSAPPASALRGEVLPEHVPAAGLLILHDGEPDEPEVTLSPLRYAAAQVGEIAKEGQLVASIQLVKQAGAEDDVYHRGGRADRERAALQGDIMCRPSSMPSADLLQSPFDFTHGPSFPAS